MSSAEDTRKAGKIAAQIRAYAISLCKDGALARDIADNVEAKTKDLGAGIAFPMDISINSIAAHYCPFSDDPLVIKKGDVVKLDIGAHINGWVADTAFTVEVGTNAYTKLIQSSKEALDAACKLAKEPGVKISDIGQAISDTITTFGYTPIANLSGHGIGQYIVHDTPTIPNFNNGDDTKLVEGQFIAIEPFATTGQGLVGNGKPSGIYRLVQIKPVRMPVARKLILRLEETYNTLPFTARWLKDIPNIHFLLRLLEKENIIDQYTQLPEKSGGMVAQFEHSVEVGYGIITK